MYKDEHKKRDRDSDIEEKEIATENKESVSVSKLFFLFLAVRLCITNPFYCWDYV